MKTVGLIIKAAVKKVENIGNFEQDVEGVENIVEKVEETVKTNVKKLKTKKQPKN